MTREDAIGVIKGSMPTFWKETKEAIQTLIPELAESEDERVNEEIRNFLIDMECKREWIAYLEKQKETLKSANSISSDCWHKVADSFPDSAREVICKDAIGNFFIGRYYKGSNSWEVSMYDDMDKSNEDNPPIVMWCDIPSEKQKEQPVVDFKIEERKWVYDAVDNIFPEDGGFISEVDFRKILKDTARHFYELGLNARKER